MEGVFLPRSACLWKHCDSHALCFCVALFGCLHSGELDLNAALFLVHDSM